MSSDQFDPSAPAEFGGNLLDTVAQKDIVLFGTSANPLHKGHVGMVRHLVRSGHFSEVWVLPVYQHIFSSKRKLAPFDHRLAMCRTSLEPVSSAGCTVRVLATERDAADYYYAAACAANGGTSPENFRIGTVDLLEFLLPKWQEQHPSQRAQFHWVLGADTYYDICAGKWKNSDRLYELVRLHVFSRSSAVDAVGVPEREGVEFHTITGEEALEAISSTRVRQLLQQMHRQLSTETLKSALMKQQQEEEDDSVVAEMMKELKESVPFDVLTYSISNQLYADDAVS